MMFSPVPAPLFVPLFSTMNILFFLLKKTEVSTFWSSFSLSFISSVDGSLGIPSFLD